MSSKAAAWAAYKRNMPAEQPRWRGIAEVSDHGCLVITPMSVALSSKSALEFADWILATFSEPT